MIQPEHTPNPNALKFVLDRTVKKEGKSSYRNKKECEHVPLAQKLFDIPGVESVHFFNNYITITKDSSVVWPAIQNRVIKTIEENIEAHNSEFVDPDPEEERKKDFTEDMKKIDKILDYTIRPYLQSDGGDIQILSYKDNVLRVSYVGACGGCPSSTAGTLRAIENTLKEEYPDIVLDVESDLF